MEMLIKGLGIFARYGLPALVFLSLLCYAIYLYDRKRHHTKRFLYASGIAMGIATGFCVAVVAVHFL